MPKSIFNFFTEGGQNNVNTWYVYTIKKSCESIKTYHVFSSNTWYKRNKQQLPKLLKLQPLSK